MFKIYQTAKTMASRASELLDVRDKWAALQFDHAVTFVGQIIEGALNETEKVGPDDKPEWRQKYTLKQLLDPDFRLPVDDETAAYDEFDRMLDGGHIHGLKYDEVG
jgi:hypothetical protein